MARKILLADDSVTAQNMGRRILTDAGYEVVTVNNGSAALKKIAELKPELVVLDVYMPGYSGLEVCQRIKASPDTAAIPILLTVGKLEPFKAEEAKKVFADAFIVKPFEATELLAILSKLEDKIVPVAAARASKVAPEATAKAAPPAKPAAKPAASPEAEANWKGRLRIAEPEPAKAKQVEPAASAFHDIRHESAAADAAPESISRNLPGDVTTEELAAITAAVAAFTSRTEEDFESGELKVIEPEEAVQAEHSAAQLEDARLEDAPAKRPPTSWEEAVRAHEAAFAELDAERARDEAARQAREQEALAQQVTAQEDSPEQAEVAEASVQDDLVAEASAVEISAAPAEIDPVEEIPAEIVSSYELAEPVEAFDQAAPQVHESPELMAIEQEVSSAVGSEDGLTEFEVNAALASLAPLDAAEDIMSQLQAAELVHDHTIDQLIDAPPAAWSEENATLGSAKWIALEVGLEENEAALILEEEMQKVYAALGTNLPASISEALQSWQSNLVSLGETESNGREEALTPELTAAAEAIDQGIAGEEPGGEGIYQSYDVVASEVQEAAPVDAAGASLAQEIAEPEEISDSSAAAAAEVAEEKSLSEAVSHETVTASNDESLAAAAAASAGPAFANAPTVSPVSAPSADRSGDREQDAELAAAWARWRQIRESVSSPQFVSQVADVATAELQEAQRQQQETATAAGDGHAAAATAAPDSDAIANIVDSVLAQLKPKLVEEIAKQLSERK